MSRRNKRSYLKSDHQERFNNENRRDNTHDTDNPRLPKQKIILLPKNIAQEAYIDSLEDPNKHIVFAVGPAGTGKTMIATIAALKKLHSGEISKIVITRPAISVDEQHGFLPGTLIEKMQPWVLPILDYFYQYYDKKTVIKMIENDVIEIAPLAYMRGRTFHNCCILADECQNSTPSQMKMLLTRIGTNSKIVVTGDMSQHDRGYEQNGLKDIINRLHPNVGIDICYFSGKDVERHPIIEDIIKMYND